MSVVEASARDPLSVDRDATIDSDAYYDDLEDWHSSSFPRLRSTASVTALATADVSHDERDDGEALGSPTDYEILLESDDTPRSLAEDAAAIAFAVEPRDAPLPAASLPQTQPQTLTLTPKKLFAPPTDVPPTSCDRCRSDLNRKLLVRCSACGFCRHLYCFSPPLRQHPALSVLPKVPRHQRPPMPALIAQWRCDSCVCSLAAVQPTAHSSDHKSVQLKPAKPKKIKPPSSSPPKRSTASSPSRSRPTAPAHHHHQQHQKPFDWYRFRAEKAARVLAVEDDREERDVPRSPLHHQLVFYSPTLALMKKTALFWQWHVSQRRRHRAWQQTMELKRRVPPKRSVMVELDAREREIFRVEQQQRQSLL